MINLLLVDDEVLSIDILLNGVNWSQLGISNVFTARSMHQACGIFEEKQVDIMICDIEMPQNSGLDLLKWVKENNYQSINIILTGHADFSYAKRAIELESMEYLLKPISFDKLEQIILQAIDRVKKLRKEADILHQAESWQVNRVKILHSFWREVIAQTIPPDIKKIKSAAKNRDIIISDKKIYRSILLTAKKNLADMCSPAISKWELNLSLMTLIVKTFDAYIPTIIMLDKRTIAVIFGDVQDIPMFPNDAEIEKGVKKIIDKSLKKHSIVFSAYLGEMCYAYQLAEQVIRLQTLDQNNVLDESRIIKTDDKPKTDIQYVAPDLNTWYQMLKEGRLADINNSTDAYFTQLKEKENLNASVLTRFQHDYLRMVYSLLEDNDITANLVVNAENSEQRFNNAAISIANMKEWLSNINQKAYSYFGAQKDTKNIVERVQEYISNNLYNDLSRDSIAGVVNLNPEYLSRLYHKETGMNLMTFIQNMKIDKAKTLLKETNYSVGELASKLGYSNFAYFSHLFKKITGLTPLQYRKSN